MPTDEFFLRRRVPVGYRVVLWVLAGCVSWLAVMITLDSSVTWWLRLVLVAPLAVGAWIAVAWTRNELVADEAQVSIRGVRSLTFSWSDVVAIEPSHYGFVFELRDGRHVAAAATAKSGLVFLPPRYDKALLGILRSRVRQGD